MTTITCDCAYCHTILNIPVKYYNRKAKKDALPIFFCNVEKCFRAYQTGRLSNKWQATHKRHRAKYFRIHHNFDCTVCGAHNSEVHHKDGNYQNGSEDNLDCLCKTHHTQADALRVNSQKDSIMQNL